MNNTFILLIVSSQSLINTGFLAFIHILHVFLIINIPVSIGTTTNKSDNTYIFDVTFYSFGTYS